MVGRALFGRALFGRALFGLIAAVGLVLTPIATSPTAAQPQGAHWGRSPYYPTCTEGPCRVVVIADKTAHGTFQTQVQRWVVWMNYVRTTYNLNLPAFPYVGPGQGLQPDPGCATAEGIISLCRNNNVVNADCPGGEGVLRSTVYNIALAPNHILSTRSSLPEDALDAADTWTAVCGQLGRSIGMPPPAMPTPA